MSLTHSAWSPTETQTKTILVVDDDLRVLSVAEDILRSMSYSVISTIDPGVALQSARDYPGAIHLLLTDVTMPLGSGTQLAAEFRASVPRPKSCSCRDTTSGQWRRTGCNLRPASHS